MAASDVIGPGEGKGLQRPYTVGTFQKRLRDFQDLMREITLQDVEATAEERRQMISETLRYDQFCDSIRALFGEDIHNQDLKALYKKITTNPDAKIDWSELFGYLQSEAEEQDFSAIEDSGIFMVSARKRVGEAAGDKKRRDTVQKIRFISSLDSYLTASQKGTLSLWNNQLKLQSCVEINESAWVTGCDYLPGLRKVAACTERSLAIWDNRAKGKSQSVFTIKPLEHSPQCMVWVPHSVNTHEDSIIFGDDEGYVNLLTIASKDLTMKNTKGDKRYSQQFSTDPKKLTNPIRRRKFHNDWVVKVKYFPELHCFASCSPSPSSSFVLEEIQRIYDDTEVRGVSIPKGVNAFDYCAKANIIATGGVDKVIRVWHPQIFSRPTGKLIGHLFTIVDIAINEKDQHIISLSTARVFRVWDIQTLASLQVFADNEERPGEKRIYSALFDNKHERLVTGSSVIDTWPLTRSVQDTMQVPHTHDRPIAHVICNHELKQVVTVCTEPVIRVWEVDSGKQVHQVTMPHGEGHEVTALTFDPAGYRLATAAQEGSVKVWDFGSGQEMKSQKSDKEESWGSVIGLNYCLFEGQRCLAVSWSSKLKLLLDSNDNFELEELREFSDAYSFTREVQLSSFEGTRSKPLPGVSSKASSASNSRKRGSVGSVASLSVSRQHHLGSRYEPTCSAANDQYIAQGCSNGEITLWNLITASMEKILHLPSSSDNNSKSGAKAGSGRRSNIMADDSKGVSVLAFLTRKSNRGDLSSVQATPTSELHTDIKEEEEEENVTDERGKKEDNGEKDEDDTDADVDRIGADKEDNVREEAPSSSQEEASPTVIVAGYQDCTVRFWSLQGVLLRAVAATTKKHAAPVTSLCFDDSCSILVTGDSKGYLTIWEIGKFLDSLHLENPHPVKQQVSWRAHLTKVSSLCYLNHQRSIVSGSTDASVRVWSSKNGRFFGFFGQPRPFNFSAEQSSTGVLPYDITEGPLTPVKSMSAKQKIRVTKQLEYPLVFDQSKWQPFRRSAYLSHRTIEKQPEDKKFFGALAKPGTQKAFSISLSCTNAIRQGAVFASLPVYRVSTPERLATPDINTDRSDSSADFFTRDNFKAGKAKKIQSLSHSMDHSIAASLVSPRRH